MGAQLQHYARRTGFLAELRRRRVLQIGAAYLVGAWLAVEVLGFLLEQAGASDSALRWVAIVFIAGFPVSVTLAWVVQVQPDGSWSIDSSETHTGALLGTAALAAVLTGGLAWTLLPGSSPQDSAPPYDPIPNSVAVLPMAVADTTPFQKTMGETLYYTLLDEISESRDITQIRLRMDERPEDLLAFGRSVRVSALLDGRVENVAGETQISARLLDVRNGETLWSAVLPWEPTRILELGAEIGNRVFEAMGASPSRAVADLSPERRQAHQLLMAGKRRAESYNVASLRLAVDNARRAVELDPGYADAHAWLSKWLWSLGGFLGRSEEFSALNAEAETAVARALELEPDLPLALSQLGHMRWTAAPPGSDPPPEDVEIARRSQEKAIALQPDFALAYFRLGYIAREHGDDLASAETLMRKALDLDPMNANFWSDLSTVLRTEEAVAALERSIELDPTAAQNYIRLASRSWHELGNIDQYIRRMREAYALDPARGDIASWVAAGYADLDMKEHAMRWLGHASSSEGWYAGGYVEAATEAMYLHLRFHDCERIRELRDEAIQLAHEIENAAERTKRLYGVCLLETGKAEAAAEYLGKPVSFSDPELACNYGAGVRTLRAIALNRALGLGLDESPVIERCLGEVGARCAETVFVKSGGRHRGGDTWACELLPMWSALTGNRETTLDALTRLIIDARRFYVWRRYHAAPLFDFLRGDPEYEQLMQHLQDDIARQRENVLRMEANGEMPPIPEVAMN